MHDYSLGAPVDVGQYMGPLLDGKPLHTGNCTDGVYGCSSCNAASRSLTADQLKTIGWSTEQNCDWCKKLVSVQQIHGIKPWDEPSIYYEVCTDCKKEHDKELQREIAYDNDKYGYED